MEFRKYGTVPEMDKLVDSENWKDREEVAKQGYALDKLVKDERTDVRMAVARCGRPQDLDVLVNDEEWIVRVAVASCGRDKDLNVLINDNNENVRMEVAKIGRPQDLKVLGNDDSAFVRAVVKQYKEQHPDWDKSISNEHKDKQTEKIND